MARLLSTRSALSDRPPSDDTFLFVALWTLLSALFVGRLKIFANGWARYSECVLFLCWLFPSECQK